MTALLSSLLEAITAEQITPSYLDSKGLTP
jgi:hypothetical protein